ncbi:MAG: hypothetical protein PHQ43_00875 [Dehalococcoidales bacterium]|nr:hypothetical protein [Dehalococcoidales bacterium]
MATFPTLYRHGTTLHTPEITGGDLAFDPTIRAGADGGYVKSRARFTRYPRKWGIRYTWLTADNKDTLLAFEEAQGVGATAFDWTNPMDSTLYSVRFIAPLRYTPEQRTNFAFWTVEFDLEQV